MNTAVTVTTDEPTTGNEVRRRRSVYEGGSPGTLGRGAEHQPVHSLDPSVCRAGGAQQEGREPQHTLLESRNTQVYTPSLEGKVFEQLLVRSGTVRKSHEESAIVRKNLETVWK